MTTVKTAATKPQRKGVLNRMLEKTAYRLKFNRTALNIQAADLLREEIAKQHIVQKELAGKLGISPARLSQILNTEEKNLTLGTIADIATALNKQFQLSLKPDPHVNKISSRVLLPTSTIEVGVNGLLDNDNKAIHGVQKSIRFPETEIVCEI